MLKINRPINEPCGTPFDKPNQSLYLSPNFTLCFLSQNNFLIAMMMRLQRYDLIISYVSGKLLYLANTLSRVFSTDGNSVSAQSNIESVCMIQSMPMTEHRILEIKKATESDDEMKLLKSIIINGWPDDKL